MGEMFDNVRNEENTIHLEGVYCHLVFVDSTYTSTFTLSEFTGDIIQKNEIANAINTIVNGCLNKKDVST